MCVHECVSLFCWSQNGNALTEVMDQKQLIRNYALAKSSERTDVVIGNITIRLAANMQGRVRMNAATQARPVQKLRKDKKCRRYYRYPGCEYCQYAFTYVMTSYTRACFASSKKTIKMCAWIPQFITRDATNCLDQK